MRTTLQKVDELTVEQQSARRQLTLTVYPPTEEWDGSSIEWASGQWCALHCDSDEQVLCYAGAIIRAGRLNDAVVKIGGIGGVMTHPDARNKGLASLLIGRLTDFFKEQQVDFALLVCEPNLIPFYERTGWQSFPGDLFVRQGDERVRFTFNLPMTKAICSPNLIDGVIDLLGPPW